MSANWGSHPSMLTERELQYDIISSLQQQRHMVEIKAKEETSLFLLCWMKWCLYNNLAPPNPPKPALKRKKTDCMWVQTHTPPAQFHPAAQLAHYTKSFTDFTVFPALKLPFTYCGGKVQMGLWNNTSECSSAYTHTFPSLSLITQPLVIHILRERWG